MMCTSATERDRQRLESLLKSGHRCISIVTTEEHHAVDMLDGVAASDGRALLTWSATAGLAEGQPGVGRPIPDTENAAAALYYVCNRHRRPAVCVFLDLAAHLDDAVTLRALREAIEHHQRFNLTLVLVDHSDDLPSIIRASSTPLELSLPDTGELKEIVKDTLQREHLQQRIEAKLRKKDLETIVRNLRGLTRRTVEQIIRECVCEDQRFDADDINTILAAKRRHLHADGILEYIEAPVDLESIGGLRALKRWLSERKDSIGEQAEAFGLVPPRGVLLLGVQGAGKSLSSKAIATAWQRPLLKLDPGRLYDRYVGESEKRLRMALHQAEMMAPIVLWVDEIEKGFASAATHSTDGGLSQRMFGTLLTWMQDHREPVFLVATANNIDALPPELLRKGRFDEIFFVDLPTADVREQIFAIHLKKRGRDPEQFDLRKLAASSDGYSGAEIEQAILSALHRAFAEEADVDTPRIIEALQQSPPLSVTMAERIARLRQWADGRCTPADAPHRSER